jgi:hypothetical protein
MLVCMDSARETEAEVGQLLDDLCVRLGFCLSPDAKRRLVQSPPGDVDAFTDAVFAAEGMDGRTRKELHRKVRTVVDQHINGWLGA